MVKPRIRKSFPGGTRLLVLDFDGVMTDNRVWVDENGKETVVVNRADGLGLARLAQAGVEVIVLSTEKNPVVAARCRKLGIPCRQGVGRKGTVLKRWMKERRLDPEDIVFVGNDVNDSECLAIAGTGVAVADSVPEVLAQADWILTRKGGDGAVREVCELILSSRPLKKGAKENHAANH